MTVAVAKVPAGVEALARAVLYEGYALYPYRPSAPKNQPRWMMGSLYPASFAVANGESSELQVETLVRAPDDAAVGVTLQFLDASNEDRDRRASERRFEVSPVSLVAGPRTLAIAVDGPTTITGTLVIEVARVEPAAFRVRVRVSNTTRVESGDPMASAMLAAHVILTLDRGRFVSLADPPPDLTAEAGACENVGVWPAVVGEDHRAVLASPMILEDNPRIAPESPGDLFDATEIDEILTLRILTMTPDEKREARASDARVRALLDRIDAMGPAELAKLHGAVRAPNAEPRDARGKALAVGDRVRLCPRARADAMDLMLAGRAATIRRIEQDFEGRQHVVVTIDDDPGQDFGRLGLPGHQFFYGPEEVELAQRRVLVACIGNIFFGDDAFGTEVAKLLAVRRWPGVRVVDFGIRGLDLAYELVAGYDAVVFVDTIARSGAAGDLFVVEPVVGDEAAAAVDSHRLVPAEALRLARTLGGGELPPFVRIVGCVPLTFGTDDEPAVGLSDPVAAALAGAVELVERILAELDVPRGV